MVSMIFIGGASASGKSTVAKLLAKKTGMDVFELDEIHRELMAQYPEGEELNEETRRRARHKIEELLSSGTEWTVEGGWIRTSTAIELVKEYGDRFKAVYVGYPNASPEDYLENVLRGGKHWLKDKTPEEALEWIKKQIKSSATYKSNCEKLDIPFIDFSNQEVGARKLVEMFC